MSHTLHIIFEFGLKFVEIFGFEGGAFVWDHLFGTVNIPLLRSCLLHSGQYTALCTMGRALDCERSADSNIHGTTVMQPAL
jgi:hypothetical protein